MSHDKWFSAESQITDCSYIFVSPIMDHGLFLTPIMDHNLEPQFTTLKLVKQL